MKWFVLAVALAGTASAQQPVPAQPKASAADLMSAADEIVRQVGALRGLPEKSKVARGVLTRNGIGERLKARMAKEYTPDEVRAESRVLRRLGLLPPNVDYEKLLLDVLMEQVAGFYDPFSAKLYIADWLPLEMQRPALAHEIEHALQDQHFGLKKFAEPIKDDGDRQLARAALVEGDGTLLMLEFQTQAMGLPVDQLADVVIASGRQMLSAGMATTPIFDKAPEFVKESLLFPYLSGLSFVATLKRGKGWAEVNKAWKSPPVSTEQVLHPEKYLAGEKPVVVKIPDLAAALHRKELRRDTLGELEWRVLFGVAVPQKDAETAAAGWGGDRIVAYVDGNAPPTVVSLSAWDTEHDAEEAETAARQVVQKLSGSATTPITGPFVDPNGDEWSVERRGDRMLVIFGAPKGTSAAVAQQVWKP
jgi:hypothetical protein